MTTLSKEDVVRWEAEADKFKTGEFTDTLDLKSFATLARADLVAENERLKGELEKSDAYTERKDVERDKLRTALAAAEARESATRAILDQVMDDIRSEAFLFDGGNGISADTEDAADNLLDQPRDDSALREMIAGVYEECAKVCDEDSDKWTDYSCEVAARDCAKAIRALSKALHEKNGVNTLDLLGHENDETGRIYSDPRGGWVEVKLPKSA